MRKILSAILIIILTIPLAACGGDSDSSKTLIIESKNGQKHIFNIDIAADSESRIRGLMFVEDMPKDKGMLFVYPSEMEASFWMKNTLIPLDIIFIKSDGTINHIYHMAMPLDETSISSQGTVKAALEINGGLAAKLGIKTGDKIIHSIFLSDK